MNPENSDSPLSPPNVVVILVDDMGFSDIGAYGSEIHTPHLDRLAGNGMRFTQMTNCARCCPTRACLLTGLYPHQAGIGLMVDNRGTPAYQGYLREDTATLAEALAPAGYVSQIAGKWHVGGEFDRGDDRDWTLPHPERPMPQDRGFTSWEGTPAGAGSYWNPKPFLKNFDLVTVEDPAFHYTDFVTDASIRQIKGAVESGKPFFQYVAYTAPHWPLHAREEDIARYRGTYTMGWDQLREERYERLQGLKLYDPLPALSPRDENVLPWAEAEHKNWQSERMAVYAAQVTQMDRGVGRILQTLDELDVTDNTLVLFLSDNGGCHEEFGEGISKREWKQTVEGSPVRFGNDPSILPGPPDTYQSYGRAWANASNVPFRLFKSFAHEGGISTPMIAHWPKRIQPGSITRRLCHVMDIMPTVLEAAGISWPASRKGEPVQPPSGESFLHELTGKGDRPRQEPVLLEHVGNRMVRSEEWKLVSRRPDNRWDLHDMLTDRTELHSLAGRYPDKVRELAATYAAWAEALGVLAPEDLPAKIPLRPLPNS